jgi:DNA-directed RNA polymerase subunit H (RpoH/RPB5)
MKTVGDFTEIYVIYTIMNKAREICKNIIDQRGYTLVEDTHLLSATKQDGSLFVVFFDDISKLNKSGMSKYLTMMKDKDSTHSIIVYQDNVTSMTTKSIDQSIDMEIELFSVDELQFNITKHRLQPSSFRRLPNDDAIKFKKTYGVKFPIMKITDPIARFYNYKQGNVIEIINKDGLVNYRAVR